MSVRLHLSSDRSVRFLGMLHKYLGLVVGESLQSIKETLSAFHV
jgi:hypothetical protein